MPTYGDDKIKDMIESLLPSSARKLARENRAAAHRKARRTLRQNHDRDRSHVVERKRREEISEMMWSRRGADKLSFCRWAVEVTKHIPDPEDRYRYIKNLVPDNTIGRHALTHIDYLDEFDYGQHSHRFYSRYRPDPEKPLKERMADALRELLETADGHKRLNAAIKYRHKRMGHPKKAWTSGYRSMTVVDVEFCDGCFRPRLLAGFHDIEDFLEDIKKNPRHDEWQKTTLKVLGFDS